MKAQTLFVAKSYINEQMAPFAFHCKFSIIRAATSTEQWEQKFDYLIAYLEKPEILLQAEIKDEKFARRSDPKPDRDRILVEYRDVGGNPGWSTFPGPLFQRRLNQFYQYDRPKLYLWAQENSTNVVDMAIPKEEHDYPETWKIYRRVNRKDAFMFGPYNTCDNLIEGIFTIPQSALDMEQECLQVVRERIKQRIWKLEYATYIEVLGLMEGLWNEMFGERK